MVKEISDGLAMVEKTPGQGEKGERHANTPPGCEATLVSYRVVGVVAWGVAMEDEIVLWCAAARGCVTRIVSLD